MKAKRTMSRFLCDNSSVERGEYAQSCFADTRLSYRTDDDRDSGTESDDEGAEIEELQKYMETIIHLDSGRRRHNHRTTASKRPQVTTKPTPLQQQPLSFTKTHYRRQRPHRRSPDSALPSDSDPHHSSEEELEVINSEDSVTKYEDSVTHFKDSVVDSEDSVTNSEDSRTRYEDSVTNSENLVTNFRDSVVDSEDSVTNFKDSITNFKNPVTNSNSRLEEVTNSEEVNSINSQKRKWCSGGGGPLTTEDGSDPVHVLMFSVPVQFRTSPPADAHRPRWCRGGAGADIPPHELCQVPVSSVSPRKRCRRMTAPVVQRPCLDFEKMQQINRVRLL